MKNIAGLAIVVGTLSLVIGVISKVTGAPVAILKGGLEARSLLEFTNTCFLIAIVAMVTGKAKAK